MGDVDQGAVSSNHALASILFWTDRSDLCRQWHKSLCGKVSNLIPRAILKEISKGICNEYWEHLVWLFIRTHSASNAWH